MSNSFTIDVTVSGRIDDVIEKVTAALATEGFGILTRVDVDKTFKKKLDVDFRPYVILGACNPNLAHQALNARGDVGIMLPCNVTVEQSGDDECLVRLADPKAMMTFADLGENETLQRLGEEAAVKFASVAAAL